jgi:hypothetical protein
METLTVGTKANYTWEYEGRRVRRFGFVITKVGRKYATLERTDTGLTLGERNHKAYLKSYSVPVTVRVPIECVEPVG